MPALPLKLHAGEDSRRAFTPNAHLQAMGRLPQGQGVLDILPVSERQQSILAGVNDERRLRVMRAVDEINKRHGKVYYAPAFHLPLTGVENALVAPVTALHATLKEVLMAKAC